MQHCVDVSAVSPARGVRGAVRRHCPRHQAGVRRIGIQRGDHRLGGVHLDLSCSSTEFASERERLLALGATETRPARVEHYGAIANLADPDGNLFDLCAYVH